MPEDVIFLNSWLYTYSWLINLSKTRYKLRDVYDYIKISKDQIISMLMFPSMHCLLICTLNAQSQILEWRLDRKLQFINTFWIFWFINGTFAEVIMYHWSIHVALVLVCVVSWAVLVRWLMMTYMSLFIALYEGWHVKK